MGEIHIALQAEKIFDLWGIPITNTLITSWVVILFLFALTFFVKKNIKIIPNKLQILFEWMVEGVLNYISEVLENKELAKKIFPLITTVFIFIFASNFLEFFPGVGSVGFFNGEEFTPLFRSVNTDLNSTLALAIIAFFTIEIVGVSTLGFLKYSHKFVNFKSVMGFFLGIIELFSEVIRLVSFSFRLFGNIFAGEVTIVVLASFLPLFLPLPIMLFEVFVGFIQAVIFSLLILFFVKLAITEPH